MSPSKYESTAVQANEVTPQVLLWMLRLLAPMGCHARLIQGTNFNSDRLAHAVGLSEWVDADMDQFQPGAAKRKLREIHVNLESQARAQPERFQADPTLLANIEHLNRLVGLSQTEQQILSLAVQLHTCSLLDDVADYLGTLSSAKAIACIAEALLHKFPVASR